MMMSLDIGFAKGYKKEKRSYLNVLYILLSKYIMASFDSKSFDSKIFTDDWIQKLKPGEIFKEPTIQNYKIPDDIGNFLRYFKWLLMQYPVRNYFIRKNNTSPNFSYNMIKIDFKDPIKKNKVDYIINNTKDFRTPTRQTSRHSSKEDYNGKSSKNNSGDFIIDIVEQLYTDGPGHWTTISYIDNELKYMDSDPFQYGSMAESENKKLHEFLSTIAQPDKSIQNLSKHDTFCQTWSLYSSIEEKSLSECKIHVLDKPNYNAQTDPDSKNLGEFLENFIFLIDFWISIFTDNGFDNIIEGSEWQLWKHDLIVNYLGQLKEYIQSNNVSQILVKNKCLLFQYDTSYTNFVESSEPPQKKRKKGGSSRKKTKKVVKSTNKSIKKYKPKR